MAYESKLVTLDYGRHNHDIEASYKRILAGASWKNQRCVAIVPTSTKIYSEAALAIWGIMWPPNQPVVRMLAVGFEVGEAYSNAITEVIEHPEMRDWEYIITLEHDNIMPPDAILKLIKRLEENEWLAAVSGLYWTKGMGGIPQIWGDPSDPVLNWRPCEPVEGKLIECNAIGMGCAVWRLPMFRDEKLRRPWFKTLADGQDACTQDIYFSQDAKKYGYRFAVDCDVCVGHLDADGIIW